MTTPALPRVPIIATDASYDAGVDPWSGQPTKVEGDGAYYAKGWIPGQSPPSVWENFYNNATGVALQDVQISALVRVVSTGQESTYSHSALVPMPTSRTVAQFTDNGGTLFASWQDASLTRRVISATDADYQAGGFLSDFSVMPDGSYGNACFLSFSPSLQGTIQYVFDMKPDSGGSGATGKNATVPAATSSKWIDLVSPYPGTFCVLDSTGATVGSNDPWQAYHAFTGTDYVALSKVPSVDPTAYPGGTAAVVYAFSPTHTAHSSTMGFNATNTWLEDAATWDGGALAGGVSLFRPTWDGPHNRWLASTADVSTEGSARATTRLWTSDDGRTWVGLTSTAFLLLCACVHRDVLYGVGYFADGGSPTPNDSSAHGGLEIVLSLDGGLNWQRTGEAGILSLTPPGTNPAFMRDRVRIFAGGNTVVASSLLSTFEWVSMQTCAGGD